MCDTIKENHPLNEKLVPINMVINEKSSNTYLYFTATIVNIIGFTSGIAFAWTSPMIPKLNGITEPELNPLLYPISPTEESWLAGILFLGAAIGPLISGNVADKIGRKRLLLLLAIPMKISFLLTAFTTTLNFFYIARLFMGYVNGSVFTVLPMYLGEIAGDNNRGLLGCYMGVFVTSGLLYAFVTGPYLSVKIFNLTCLVPLIIFVIILWFFVPESPSFLAMIGDYKSAEISLKKLRGHSNIQKELLLIKDSVENDNKDLQKSSFTELFTKKAALNGFIVSSGLIILQQFSGISPVLSYLQSIFDASGSDIAPEISAIIIGVIQLITTILTTFIVERVGRKILLLYSSLLSSVSLITLGIYFYLKEISIDVSSLFWLPIVSLILYIITFNLGLGPMPWAMLGELFQPNVKSLASSLTSFICFIFGFFLTVGFPQISVTLGMAYSLWLFALLCFVGIFFIKFIVPETKGKTSKEIQLILAKDYKK